MMSTKTATITTPADDQILITREFDAPKHLVYKAWTTPELVERWWGGRRGNVTSVEMDLRVGGSWRYVLIANEGFEVGFHGEYLEIVPNERIVHTEIFEGMPDGDSDPVVNTVSFIEDGGRTRLELLTQCPNQEVRDAILGSGMEVGMQEQMEIIDEILPALR
jgi:uncharacterized protein YndB with AHSA1/START domain